MIRVLIAEDDPMVAEIGRLYLEQVEGFSLAGTVCDAAEALAFCRTNRVDLILLDIFLRGSNGLDALEELRHQGVDVDVIPVTAASDTATIRTALQMGAVDYLIKPFGFSRFRQALEHVRECREHLRNGTRVSQEELDHLLRRPQEAPGASRELPKGLDRRSLEKIWTAVVQREIGAFSAEDVAFAVGLSRVSVRKYLDFLHDEGFLSKDVAYGCVGRPVHRYALREVDAGKKIESWFAS